LVFGRELDVAALLAEASPRQEYETWSAADPPGEFRMAETAGVACRIAVGLMSIEVVVLTDRFLEAEKEFLRATARRKAEQIWSVLYCETFATVDNPSSLYFPVQTLRQLAELDVDLWCSALSRADVVG
jgi:hypothetical protein